jgi:hypothetical protein
MEPKDFPNPTRPPICIGPVDSEELVRAFRRSGLSQSEFCRRQGVSYWKLNRLLQKKRTGVLPPSAVSFVEATVSLPKVHPVEIDLPSGIRVRFYLDPEKQSRILRELLK